MFFVGFDDFDETFSGNQRFLKTPAFLTSLTGLLGSQDVLEATDVMRRLSSLWLRVEVSN